MRRSSILWPPASGATISFGQLLRQQTLRPLVLHCTVQLALPRFGPKASLLWTPQARGLAHLAPGLCWEQTVLVASCKLDIKAAASNIPSCATSSGLCTMQVPGSETERLAKGYNRFHCYSASLIQQVQAYLLLDHMYGIESAAIMWGSASPLDCTLLSQAQDAAAAAAAGADAGVVLFVDPH